MATVFVRECEVVGAVTVDWPGFLARATKAMHGGLPLPLRNGLLRELTTD
jgi:hypothetical protein